jgi:hypothetical protein
MQLKDEVGVKPRQMCLTVFLQKFQQIGFANLVLSAAARGTA